jgi:hypothetical protein
MIDLGFWFFKCLGLDNKRGPLGNGVKEADNNWL